MWHLVCLEHQAKLPSGGCTSHCFVQRACKSRRSRGCLDGQSSGGMSDNHIRHGKSQGRTYLLSKFPAVWETFYIFACCGLVVEIPTERQPRMIKYGTSRISRTAWVPLKTSCQRTQSRVPPRSRMVGDDLEDARRVFQRTGAMLRAVFFFLPVVAGQGPFFVDPAGVKQVHVVRNNCKTHRLTRHFSARRA